LLKIYICSYYCGVIVAFDTEVALDDIAASISITDTTELTMIGGFSLDGGFIGLVPSAPLVLGTIGVD